MNNYYYILFIVFTIISTMIIIDQNVGDYILLIFKIFKVNIEKTYWKIRFHPLIFSSPIVKWWMMRKYLEESRKLQEELIKKDSNAL